MLQNKSFTCVIPARGGSKGLKNKNIIPLLGRPLIYYVLKAAESSHIFDEIIVSTDSLQIKAAVEMYGHKTIDRPVELAQDDTPTEPVIAHALTKVPKTDYVCLLQPTAPLVLGADILTAAKKLLKTKKDLIISVCESNIHWVAPLGENESMRGFYPEHLRRKPRQQVGKYYQLNGAIYMGKWDIFAEQQDFYDTDSVAYVMPPDSFLDINYYEDVIEAEKRLRRREWAKAVLSG